MTALNGFFVPCVAAALIILSVSWHQREADALRQRAFYVGVGLICYERISSGCLEAAARLHPATMDGYLYRADRVLGIDTFGLGRWLAHHSLAWNVCVVAYLGLPVLIGLVYAIERPNGMMRTLQLCAVLGFVCYQLVPACGPAHAFAEAFPWEAPTVGAGLTAVDLRWARNCMPSLHLSWALMAVVYAKRPWLRALAIITTWWIGVATVGSGEHYWVDLVAAVPFTWLVFWLSGRLEILYEKQARVAPSGTPDHLGNLPNLPVELPRMR